MPIRQGAPRSPSRPRQRRHPSAAAAYHVRAISHQRRLPPSRQPLRMPHGALAPCAAVVRRMTGAQQGTVGGVHRHVQAPDHLDAARREQRRLMRQQQLSSTHTLRQSPHRSSGGCASRTPRCGREGRRCSTSVAGKQRNPGPQGHGRAKSANITAAIPPSVAVAMTSTAILLSHRQKQRLVRRPLLVFALQPARCFQIREALRLPVAACAVLAYGCMPDLAR